MKQNRHLIDVSHIWDLPTKDEALERLAETAGALSHMHPADAQAAEYDAVQLAFECGATDEEVKTTISGATTPSWPTTVGKHEVVLAEGQSLPNLTRTGHQHHGPARFTVRVWEDGGIDITEVDA